MNFFRLNEIMRNDVLTEAFDTVSDFMLNPEHRDKTWDQLMGEFEASGGKYVGSGKYASVFDHPSWLYVLKLFSHDDRYIPFVRFAYRNPHPSFPKFFGPPQRIVPFYKRTAAEAKTYLVRIEKLKPLSKEIGEWLGKFIGDGAHYIKGKKEGMDFIDRRRNTMRRIRQGEPEYVERNMYQHVEDMLGRFPKLHETFEGWNIIINSDLKGALDAHANNFMQRSNGDIVIIDPLWTGSNPYADHQAMMDLETDRWGGDEPPEPTLIGGELPKKKRKRKIKKKSAARGFYDRHGVTPSTPEVPF
jgi:hypothetical protein